jgi:hypothetical protein
MLETITCISSIICTVTTILVLVVTKKRVATKYIRNKIYIRYVMASLSWWGRKVTKPILRMWYNLRYDLEDR